jgi:hypothetical protein
MNADAAIDLSLPPATTVEAAPVDALIAEAWSQSLVAALTPEGTCCCWDAEFASVFAGLDPAPEVVPAPRVYTPPKPTLLSTALAKVRGLT